MTHDEPDPTWAPPSGARVVATAAIVVVLGGVAMTFLLALGAGRPGPDLGVVVVTDPVPRAAPTPVLAMVVGPGAVAALSGTVNGARAEATSIIGIVDVATSGGVDVVGRAHWRGTWEPVALRVSLTGSPALSTTLAVSKASTLAIPATGAAVYPVAGLVPPAGRSEVVLVDDEGVRVIDVDVAADGRLPDGRLLAVDRRSYTARLHAGGDVGDGGDGGDVGDVVVAVVARSVTVGLVSVAVGGRLVALRRLAVPPEETARLRIPIGSDHRGDVVVATISTAIVPGVGGATDLQLVGRMGGLSNEDLLRVEPRAAPALTDPRVREALGRRLTVEGGGPPVVSPSLSQQRQDQLEGARRDADAARGRFRAAAVALLAAVVLAGVAGGLSGARRRGLAVIAAVVLVGGMLLGLDRVLDGVAQTAAFDLAATSGSP